MIRRLGNHAGWRRAAERRGFASPLAAEYRDVTSTGDTSSLIVANLNDASALASPVPQYPYSLALAAERPEDTFQQAGPGVYFRPSFADPSNWKVWAAAGGRPLTFDSEEARPFPNPFLADGSARLSLPGPGPSAELRIYDGAMQLVYAGRQAAGANEGTAGEPTDPDSLAGPAPTPEESALGAAVERAVQVLLVSLPEKQRAAFVLGRFEGLSYEEIADVLGTTVPAVKSLVHRATVACAAAPAPYALDGKEALP